MNVLFVGGGRRIELAKRFIARGYKIFAYELHSNVPISSVARIVEGCKWTDEGLSDHLLATIQEHNIDLVFPLQDEAIRLCAELSDVGAKVVASNPETADICFDKFEFEDFIMGVLPNVYPVDISQYPKIIKPRFGFGSRNVRIANSLTDIMRWEKELGDRLYLDNVIQRKIEGVEYSVDSYFDRDCKWVQSVPRTRIRVGSGEVITSKTVYNPKLRSLTALVGEKLGIRGPSNTQWIVDKHGHPYIVEVNARFGGGYTLSMEAGMDTISFIEYDYFGIGKSRVIHPITYNLLLERSYRDHYYG